MPTRPTALGDLPTHDASAEGAITVVIETSKGSRNKLGYDVATGTFRLKHVLPAGSSFPYDFGFVPGTTGGDGDPLDVLVFLEEPVPCGTVVPVRLIGVIEATQREQDGDKSENSRFLGVPALARDTEHIRSLDDLRPGLIDEIEAFFAQYNRLRGDAFEVTARGGPDRARTLLQGSMGAGDPAP